VSGRTVQYAVTQGNASLSSVTAVSNAAGYATVDLKLSSLAAEVHASACVMPGSAPCSNFYVLKVSAADLRLQYVAGEQQIINTAQPFSPVTLRVTDSSAPHNPVQMAPVAVLSAVLRWRPAPVSAGPSPQPPPAPVVLSSAQRVVYSDSNGLVSIVPSAEARFGAVSVRMIAFVGSGLPLQFEVQRMWAPPGWVSSSSTAEKAFVKSQTRQRPVISSPRHPPID